MENNSSTSHFKIPRIWPIPLTLGLFVLIEVLLTLLLPEGLMTNTLHKHLDEIVTLPAAPIQIMGDSVSAALNAAVIAETAQLPEKSVSNYSLPGTSPLFAYFVLKRQIAAGKVPNTIIYAPHPANLGSPMVDRFLGRYVNGSEFLEFARAGVPLSELLFGAACRFSYTVRYREEMQTVVTQGKLDFFQTMSMPVKSVVDAQVRPEPIPQRPTSGIHQFTEENLPPQLRQVFTVDEINAHFIDRFCQLAREHGIEILWVSMPGPRVLDDTKQDRVQREKYYEFLAKLEEKHPNIHLLYPEVDIAPDEQFADVWHLNKYGAYLFSNKLGTRLKGLNNGSRGRLLGKN